MNEDIKNIAIICSECAPKPQNKYSTMNVQSFIGEYVKKSFKSKDSDETEHLWIKVTKVIDNETLEGIINNDVILNIGFKFGDTVSVKLKEIENCLSF